MSAWLVASWYASNWAPQGVQVVKNPHTSAGDIWEAGLIPGLGRSPGEENGNPLQYSCLENPMDGGTQWATHSGRESASNAGDIRDAGLIPGSRRSPRGGNGNPLQYSYLEKSHGQRSLVGYNLWGLQIVRHDFACTRTRTHTHAYTHTCARAHTHTHTHRLVAMRIVWIVPAGFCGCHKGNNWNPWSQLFACSLLKAH